MVGFSERGVKGNLLMKIKFWGVRGSVPTPLTSDQIKRRISAIVQRIQPEDLKSQESREAFLGRLPDYLFGTVGGNTTCIEVKAFDDCCVIVDSGTGIRELGNYYASERKDIKEFHIFFTHLHWDHIQGLPFFAPAFNKENSITFYSPLGDLEFYLKEQMKYPYFPIDMSLMAADIQFKQIPGEHYNLRNMSLRLKKLKHPGGCWGYKFSMDNKNLIIATDAEITENEFKKCQDNIDFFSNTDILILDSQYTLQESIAKIDWGHSSYSIGVDLASEWKVKKLALFHHEPLYQDKKILGINRTARWYLKHLDYKDIDVFIAVENQEIEL